MPSLTHEAILELLRRRPSLAPELLRDAMHVPVAHFDRVTVGEGVLTQLPVEYRADLVLLLESAESPEPAHALVVEVQLGVDDEKRWTWPVYLAALRARLRCPVALVVVTPYEAVATWAMKPIELGHPGSTMTPLVLGPKTVPLVLDEAQGVRGPELALLSVFVHGRGPHALDVARAALAAAEHLDDSLSDLYIDLVLGQAPAAVRAILEALMTLPRYEPRTELASRNLALGKAEGKAEGNAEGQAAAVITVLTARGIAVTPDVRERILACKDAVTLDVWLRRAATAQSATDVLDDLRAG